MIDPITDEMIAALEMAAKEATPGPWTCYQPKGYSFDQINADNGSCVASDVDALYSTGNGPYIAAANPTTILSLIARLRAAEEDLDTWKSVFPDIAPDNVLPDRSVLEAQNATLKEQVERLREALKPFADAADDADQNPMSEMNGGIRCPIRYLRRARAALEDK